jgi:hypothetical protein
VVTMTAAAVTFFRPEFDDFLYAAVGWERNEMPLTVLSALSRLDVDPWKMAADLSQLPKEHATQRLASLLARLPGGLWAPTDARDIADRLIELLQRRDPLEIQLTDKAHGLQQMISYPVVLICAALGLAVLIAAVGFERSTRSDNVEPPAFSRDSPPQTLVPSSR